MELQIHTAPGGQLLAELVSYQTPISTEQDALDILANSYYLGAEALVLKAEQLDSAFFELKTGLAGAILQKFSNYRMKLAIIGDFSAANSKSLQDFIYESNKTRLINFVVSREEAFQQLFQ